MAVNVRDQWHLLKWVPSSSATLEDYVQPTTFTYSFCSWRAVCHISPRTKWLNVPIPNLLWETLIWKDTVHVWVETKSVCCLHQALNDLVASIKWWKTEFRSIVVALTLGRILKDYSTTFLTLKKDTFTVISCKTRTIPGFNSVTSAFYTYFSIFYANVSLLLLCTILFLSTTVFIYFKTET